MTIALSIVISIITAWFLAKPFFLEASEDALLANSNDTQSLIDQKNRCVQVLKDLELDYSTLKLSEEDYKQLQISLRAELAEILRTLDTRSRSS